MEKKIKGYKGFDKDLKCRGHQYEVGKDYEHDGKVSCCNSGFHFCENPMDVLGYYNPADSRYCEVEGSGTTDKDTDDTKVAVSKLHISAEIGLKGLIEAGVKFILDKVNWKDNKESNTGYQSAATNTGYQSAATNTGYQSAATNTGNRSAATNTGYQSAATNTGYQSAATVEGKDSIAIVTGYDSKAKGALGCWIVLTERGGWNGNGYPIKEVKAFLVDGEIVKADTFYKLIDGEAVEVE
nr:MAG TPA: hypothetical protein [Caudoviricetes sp.]